MDQPNELMTPSDVARYLVVPVKTLYRWRHQGTGPRALRVGRHLRYRSEDLASWLEAQSSPGDQAAPGGHRG